MPMEVIELVAGKHINIALHKLYREEMAHNIEMHAPVCEPRIIDYMHSRQQGNDSCSQWKQLYKRLHSIENAGGIIALYQHAFLGRHSEAVASRNTAISEICHSHSRSETIFIGRNTHRYAKILIHIISKVFGREHKIRRGYYNGHTSVNTKRIGLGNLYLHRFGNYGKPCRTGLGRKC